MDCARKLSIWLYREARPRQKVADPAGRSVGLRVVGAAGKLPRYRRTLLTDSTATKPARRFARKPAQEAAGAPAPEGAPTPAPRAESKIGQVIRLLERSEGATLDEMVTATGWLPHTTRAALTGLKKKGHLITKGKRGDVTCYFIVSAQA